MPSAASGVTGAIGWVAPSGITASVPWNGEAFSPKPAAIPSLSCSKRFWSTWLIANITMNSTISRVIMSA